VKTRARLFRYVGLEIGEDSLTGHYELDGRPFCETVTFEGVPSLSTPAVRSVGELWYLIAGLSYYKAGAASHIDLGATRVGVDGRRLLFAALHDGLGEYAFKNDLTLDDVVITGGSDDIVALSPLLDNRRVLTPFGGGIDSVVTVCELAPTVEQTLFVVSPSAGRFEPLENTAAVTGLSIVRAQRELDPQILSGDDSFFNGHVPVTAMVTLLAVVAAVASGRGGVAMSNEHSASSPNVLWFDQAINHQWSKSWNAEELIGAAVRERIGLEFSVASFLRDRSELWVAHVFARHSEFHHVFRSCNRAFTQSSDQRAKNWCGECDKCLFIALVLAPFLSRSTLLAIFGSEPLANPALHDQLRTLLGVGYDHKPFECVGDPDESAVALRRVSELSEWSDVPGLIELVELTSPERDFDELFQSQGPSRVPAHWLR
jgi:hypothetical protein